MSEAISGSPEKKETLDDNARKFTLQGLSPAFLRANNATSFLLTTDWLRTDEDSEEKLAYKKFEDGEVQILLITKVTNDGKRTSLKEKISEERYEELKTGSILRVEKNRFEFSCPQDGVSFSMKYDEFAGSKLRVLEVDAANDTERDLFTATNFPEKLTEVTGDLGYYGYRVAGHLDQ